MHPLPAPGLGFSREDEEAGGTEAFEDAALYDFEYRRRRADVRFYLRIAEEFATRSSNTRVDPAKRPVLDLACGSGRLLIPLLRAGKVVVGLDRSRFMLARAAARLRRLAAKPRARAMLLQGDLRALPTVTARAADRQRLADATDTAANTSSLAPRFGLAICAFHSLQHLVSDTDLLRFFRGVRRTLVPGGWLAFDILPPDPRWIERDSTRRWGRTQFRHPVTGQRFVYTNNHVYDAGRRALHIRLYYQPIDLRGRPTGPELVRRLCHRQLHPAEVTALCRRAGLDVIARFGGFDGRPLAPANGDDDENIYVARRPWK